MQLSWKAYEHKYLGLDKSQELMNFSSTAAVAKGPCSLSIVAGKLVRWEAFRRSINKMLITFFSIIV